MSDQVADFLLARLVEREVWARPKTAVVSGGWPAPEVPNCIGPSGTGDCRESWRLDAPAGAGEGWWKSLEVQAAMRAHEWSHATAEQAHVRAECRAQYAVVQRYERLAAEAAEPHAPTATVVRVTELRHVLREFAAVWADHPDAPPDLRKHPV